MPKPTKGPRIGGSPTHQRIILANLATQLFEHGRITTTETRARRVQPLAEKLITKAKRGDLHSRRIVMRTVRDTTVVHVLFTEIAPAVAGRDGGYTRITKVGPRKGDNAPMAIIELVTEEVKPKTRRKRSEPSIAKKPASVSITVDDSDEVPEEVETLDVAVEDDIETEDTAEDESKDSEVAVEEAEAE